MFIKNVLKQSLNIFNSKLGHQWKDRKSSYQVRQILATFSNLVALILGYNSVKGFRVTKIVKTLPLKGSGAN